MLPIHYLKTLPPIFFERTNECDQIVKCIFLLWLADWLIKKDQSQQLMRAWQFGHINLAMIFLKKPDA